MFGEFHMENLEKLESFIERDTNSSPTSENNYVELHKV